jgi:uncharacterized SAM-binding protein YcdF (DUF218 family)
MNKILLFHHLLEALINPFMLLLILLALSILWFFIYGDSWVIRGSLLFVLVGFLVMSTGWLPTIMVKRFEQKYTVVNEVNTNIRWVVVLGGGMKEEIVAPVNQLLSSASVQRLVEGVRLYRLLPGSKLILSGGGGVANPNASIATQLSKLGTWFTIPAQDMVLETKSINTVAEAVAIKKWVHNEPFYLVTSAIHMPRAMALCRKQGLNPIAAPADYPYDQETMQWLGMMIPNASNMATLRNVWHEMLGMAWEKMKGQID